MLCSFKSGQDIWSKEWYDVLDNQYHVVPPYPFFPGVQCVKQDDPMQIRVVDLWEDALSITNTDVSIGFVIYEWRHTLCACNPKLWSSSSASPLLIIWAFWMTFWVSDTKHQECFTSSQCKASLGTWQMVHGFSACAPHIANIVQLWKVLLPMSIVLHTIPGYWQ